MNWNHPQVWIILAVVGLSFLQWVVQRIREQAAINKAREAARRSKEESLRTGRAPEARQQEAREAEQARTALDEKQRQAVERRQEQLRELRRKQMDAQSRARARAGSGGATATPTRPTTIPPAARVPTPPPTRPTPAKPAPRQAQPAPQQPQQRRNMTQRTMTNAPGTLTETERITRQRQEEALRRQQMMRGAPSLAPSAAPESEEETLRPALARLTGLRGVKAITTPDAHAATTSGSDLLANLDADDWRRGIILAEILRDPVGLRDAFPSRVG